jgi:hypothetical protein
MRQKKILFIILICLKEIAETSQCQGGIIIHEGVGEE